MNAAILAGGKGSRMDFTDKALLTYKGQTFLEIIVDKLASFDKILVVTNRERTFYKGIEAEFRGDIIKDTGPMGGIYTALSWSDSHYLFITTCDMPFISGEQINLIKEEDDYDIVVPSFEGKLQMLFARYSRNCLPRFKRLLEEKRFKITGIFEDNNLTRKIIDVDKSFIDALRNINTLRDYRNL